jgi:Retroviral aspartyl protease
VNNLRNVQSEHKSLATELSDSNTAYLAKNQDRMLLRRLWLDIQEATGRQFSLDACADDRGDNAHCSEYCSPAKSFLVTELEGHHVWINAPFLGLNQFVDRYLQQKARYPDVSACILVPSRACDHPVHDKLQHMQTVVEYPPGTVLFSAPSNNGIRRVLPPCPFAVKVYYDPPAPVEHKLQSISSSALSMLVEGQLSLSPATFLLDSGASACFLSEAVAKELQLSVTPYKGNVVTADGNSLPITGSCSANIKIQSYQHTVRFLVCEMTDQFDAVLGDNWLSKHKAHLDYAATDLRLAERQQTCYHPYVTCSKHQQSIHARQA